METITAIFVYSISVYGIAWILTKSRLFSFYRDIVLSIFIKTRDKNFKENNFLTKTALFLAEEWKYFSNCIVCNSAWVGALISITSAKNSVLYGYIVVSNPLDLLTWVGYSCGITWLIAITSGDAE